MGRTHLSFRFVLVAGLFCALAAAPAFAAPAVTAVTGNVANSQSITISGTGFGAAGPNVVLFDDFEKGTDGSVIAIGANSAEVGQWNSRQGSPYYESDSVVSGSLSFRANMATTPHNIEALFPANTRDFFMSWWMYVPAGEPLPGEGMPDSVNWKTVWVLGQNTTDDDITLPTILVSSTLITANASPYTRYVGSPFITKGQWKRVWVWTKGGYSNDGQCHYWQLNPTGIQQIVNDNNVTMMNSGGIRERAIINGYGRTTPNCHTGFDDVYIATGANARARIEIGNSDTYANCTKLTLATPDSWSDTQIQAKFWAGQFSPSDPAYLYVFDADGNRSPAFPLALAADTSPPTIDTVTVIDFSHILVTFSEPLDHVSAQNVANYAIDHAITVSSAVLESGDKSVTITTSSIPENVQHTLTVNNVTDIASPPNAITPNTTASFIYTVGLESHWKLDETSGATAVDSVGSRNGVLIASPTWTTGHINGALDLNGAGQAVILPSDSLTRGRSELTLMMWVNPDEWVSTNTIYDEYVGQTWQFTIREGSWYTRDASTGAYGSRNNDLALPAVNTGQWTHLAFVYSVSKQLKAIYVNGQLAQSTNVSIDALTTDRSGAALAYASDGTTYDGRLDDVRFYSRALSEPEIAAAAGLVKRQLTVVNGSGSGSFTPGATVPISADTPPAGQFFDAWTGDTASVTDRNAASTTITMPDADVSVTATYATSGSSGPVISLVDGTPADGQPLTAIGHGFGPGDTALLLWDDFESGTAGADLNASPQRGSWQLNNGSTSAPATYSTARAHSGSQSSRGADSDGSAFHSQFGTAFPHTSRKFYASFWFQRVGDQGTGQTKLFQLWGTYVQGDYNPGVMSGGFSGEWFASYITLEDTSGSYLQQNWPMGAPAKDTWHYFEAILEQSDPSVDNGNVILRIDGQDVYRHENVKTREHADEYWDILYYFYGYTNVPAGSGLENYLDDVYLNDSWTRVMIGDAPSWSACSHLEMQVLNAWSDAQVQFTAHKGAFDTLEGKYLYIVDANGVANAQGYPLTLNPGAAVTGRYILYNGSAFDGDNLAVNVDDDDALAPDKTSLLPGQTATFANYSSFSRGLNAVVIDIAHAAAPAMINTEDIQCNVGNSNDLSSWTPAPQPTVTVRPAAGENGADRVTLTWPDGAIAGKWLQVTVRATANTGLAGDDVFYFGNAIGETGNRTSDAHVNAFDVGAVRDHPRNSLNPAGLDDRYDFNRDRNVNAADMATARDHATNVLNGLKLLSLPAE